MADSATFTTPETSGDDLEEERAAPRREVEEPIRWLQGLTWQGWLEAIPPALLACVEAEGA